MGPGKCLGVGGGGRENLQSSAMAVWNTITPRVDTDVGGFVVGGVCAARP